MRVAMSDLFINLIEAYQILPGNDIPADFYLLKVNNRNNRTRFKICSKLTIKTPERRQRRVNQNVLMFRYFPIEKFLTQTK